MTMTLDRSRYTIAGSRPPARRDARVPRTGTKNPSFRPHRKPSRRSTSLGYGTPVSGTPPRARAYAPGTRHPPTPNARGLSRNGQHAGHDALYGPPSALVGFFTPSDSSHMTARFFCISTVSPPDPRPRSARPVRAGRCGPARTCAPALGRSSPRLLAYTVTTVAGTARAIHELDFTHISPPPDF